MAPFETFNLSRAGCRKQSPQACLCNTRSLSFQEPILSFHTPSWEGVLVPSTWLEGSDSRTEVMKSEYQPLWAHMALEDALARALGTCARHLRCGWQPACNLFLSE